jgi:hypothetical protein
MSTMGFAPSAEGTAGLGDYIDRSHLPGLMFNALRTPATPPYLRCQTDARGCAIVVRVVVVIGVASLTDAYSDSTI